MYFSVGVANARNRPIVDLDKAVNLTNGKVEFAADFIAVRPKDPGNDLGADWSRGIVGFQPPKVGKAFPVLVPQIDADGNERDGVPLPEITVPLATYTAAMK